MVWSKQKKKQKGLGIQIFIWRVAGGLKRCINQTTFLYHGFKIHSFDKNTKFYDFLHLLSH
jgi:hypothetical protein